ncbi:MAG: IS91 family transposase, partial [Candidatus Thiodiazotropha sp.]
EPLDFIGKLAALVPPPRANLTRFRGVFAPNSHYRARVVPGRQKPSGEQERPDEEATPAERRASMTWAQRLKRVFGIDIETCPACGGAVHIVAYIEDADVIEKMLKHVDEKSPGSASVGLPPSRASPRSGLFG